MTPIKTGAWVWRDEYNDGHWCDLYVIGNCLIARVFRGPRDSSVYSKEELMEAGLWATMHTCPGQFGDNPQTWVSDNYTLHYELQFKEGSYHTVKLGEVG